MAAGALIVWSEDGIRPELRRRFERAATELPSRVTNLDAFHYEDHRVVLRVWQASTTPRQHIQRLRDNGGVLALVGNPTLGRGAGVTWESVVEDCSRRGGEALEQVWPPFAAFLRDTRRDTLTIATDRFALQHVYLRETPDGATWASTSAFALAALGAELDVEAASEWACVGHFLSGRTFFRGIRQLACGERTELRPTSGPHRTVWQPFAQTETSESDFRSAVLEAVDTYSAEPDGLFFEVTGGLDTRLLLAARLRSAPSTRTWTIGQPDDVEMRTIRRLQHVVPFDHLLVTPPDDIAEELPTLIGEMHSLADGEANALAYTSLLIAFRGLEGIRRTSVTGSGGEIARGFYWAALARRGEPNTRGISVDRLVRRVTRDSGQLKRSLRPDLDATGGVTNTVAEFVRSSPFRTPQAILDDFYLRTRMRRFAGRNITTTGLFCLQGVPFFSHAVVDAALALPPQAKRDSRAIRSAVSELMPALARVPLASGDPVPPLSYAHPLRLLQRSGGLARKGVARYGGAVGRRVVNAAQPSMPWRRIADDAAFRGYVGDLLLTRDTRSAPLFDQAALEALVRSGLETASLYPLGLLLTIELTLRRFGLDC